MSTRKQTAAIAGAGAAACAVCCAGPVLGFLAAIGLGTVAGVLLFGVAGLAIAVLGTAIVVYRRRRARTCALDSDPMPVELTQTGNPRR